MVQRADDCCKILLHHMGIDLCGLHIRMAHQLLDYPDIDSVFKHMCGKTVAECKAAPPLCPDRLYLPLNLFVQNIALGLLGTVSIMVIPQNLPHLVHKP